MNQSDNNQEIIIINPYNTQNKLVNSQFIETIIQSKVNNLSIYQQAFVHKSYCKKFDYSNDPTKQLAERPNNCLDLFKKSNEELELLGDSKLGGCVTNYLYHRFYGEGEGFMTKMKTRLVNTDALAKFAKFLGLQEYLIISKHVEDRCNGRNNNRILEDLFESFIGAIFLDNKKKIAIIDNKKIILETYGYEIINKLILRILKNTVDFMQLIKNDNNYKDILLRYYQHNYHITPKYVEVKIEGPPHQRIFTMGVVDINNKIIGIGTEKSKKKAEQLASKQALEKLGELEDSSESSNSDDSDSEEDLDMRDIFK